MADEQVFFEERVGLREFGAPGEVRRRRAWSWLGRPAFVPTHVRVTDRRVQVGDRTILLAHVSEVGLEHDEAERARDTATKGGVWPWEPKEAYKDRVGWGIVMPLVAGAAVMWGVFFALLHEVGPWTHEVSWARFVKPVSMSLGVGLSLAAAFQWMRFSYVSDEAASGGVFGYGMCLLAFSAYSCAVGDAHPEPTFAVLLPIVVIGLHMEWARQRRFLAEHVTSPTYALSITTGGTRTLTVESEDRDAMHRLLEATRRALVAR